MRQSDSRPRGSCTPRSSSVTSLDRPIIPKPIIGPHIITFSKTNRESRLIGPIPHDKRFEYNPRDATSDLINKTRYSPFPIADFRMQTPRNDKLFHVRMSISTLFKPRMKLPSNMRIIFNKMTPRYPEKCPKNKIMITPKEPPIITSKLLEKLSTHKRGISPLFGKITARSKEGKLPCFMENLTNRMSIESTCFETLKATNYFNYTMPAQRSSICIKKGSIKKTPMSGTDIP